MLLLGAPPSCVLTILIGEVVTVSLEKSIRLTELMYRLVAGLPPSIYPYCSVLSDLLEAVVTGELDILVNVSVAKKNLSMLLLRAPGLRKP